MIRIFSQNFEVYCEYTVANKKKSTRIFAPAVREMTAACRVIRYTREKLMYELRFWFNVNSEVKRIVFDHVQNPYEDNYTLIAPP